MSRAVRWWVAGLVTAAAFTVAVWVAGAFALPPLMNSGGDRWAVAAGLGTAVAAFVALWGQSWVMREGHAAPGGERGPGQDAGGPGADASVERAITAGGDITGIASTGDDTTNIQHQ